MSSYDDVTSGKGAALRTPSRRPAIWRRIAIAAAFVAGGFVLVFVAGFVAFTTQIAAREPSAVKAADAIVVLTGGASRIADGMKLLVDGRGRRLLITGVNPSISTDELRRTLPDGDHLLGCCVDLGHRALNTRGNALEAADWTRSQGYRSIVVVTSAWHMPRAMVELGRELPEVEFVSYPVVTDRMLAERWWTNPQTLKLLFKEYLKYIMAMAKIRPVQAVAPTVELPARPAPVHKATAG